jgi:hypothetical protein
MSNQNPSLVTPDLLTLLGYVASGSAAALNCVQVGTIKAFDSSTLSATVQLVLQQAVDNNPAVGSSIPSSPRIVPYPTLVQVPVFVITGGAAALTMPIAAGDTCIVLFNDRDLDPWWSTGTVSSPPNSYRTHSLADGICLVGIRSRNNPILGYDGASATLFNGTASFRAGAAAATMAFGTTQVKLDNLVNIQNSATSLLAVMNAVVTALNALHGNTGPDASAAITAASALIAGLLE